MSQATQYKALLAQVDLSDQGSILGYATSFASLGTMAASIANLIK